MRSLDIRGIDIDFSNSLTSAMESIFISYYKNKKNYSYINKEMYSNLYGTSLYSSRAYIKNTPSPVRFQSDINIYTLETTSKDARYIPGMLITLDKENITLASVELGDTFTSPLLGMLLESILENNYERANALLRTMQAFVQLQGDFKGYEFKIDTTIRDHNSTDFNFRKILR